jgi:prepilin-type processing-associated H-X9-DG protein
LVVISIIGMLVGLLLPAVNSARESGRRTVCVNNMRSVGQALILYENKKQTYPGYLNVLMMNNGKPYTNQQTGQKMGVSFVVLILQELDQPVLLSAWKTPAGQALGTGSTGSSGSSASGSSGGSSSINLMNFRLESLLCPSDPPTSDLGTPMSYVVNTGMQDSTASAQMPRDWADNGVFFDRYTGDPRVNSSGGGGSSSSSQTTQIVSMNSAYVMRGDGLQNTVLVSENVDAGNYTDQQEAKLGMVWSGTGTVNTGSDPPNLNPSDDNMRINRGTGMSDLQGGSVQTSSNTATQNSSSSSSSPQASVFARPSSYHPGGVNMAFCDGRVTFVSQDIDYYVYCMLLSSNGARVRKPGTNNVLPNFNRPMNATWLTQ